MTSPLAPSSQELPRAQRIAKRREFLHIYEAGRKEAGRFAVVFVHPNEFGYPRLGITVTRKVGKAHVRNRLKRWTREVFRTQRGPAGLSEVAIDLVVNVKPTAAGVEFGEFSRDLVRLLRRSATVAR